MTIAKPTRPYVRCLGYGPPGSKKSTFFATFPKPMIVFSFDPPDKAAPYERQGDAIEYSEGEFGQPITLVKQGDETRIQIEHYVDTESNAKGQLVAWAYRTFLEKRFPILYNEVREGVWDTVIIDSVTYIRRAARAMFLTLNPQYQEPRKWDAETTDALERMLGSQLVGLPCNLGVIAHVDKAKDEVGGLQVAQIASPGRLSKSDGLAAGYAELYYLFTKRDDTKLRYFLQSKPSNRYNANSAKLNCPDMIENPTFEDIWKNSPWKGSA